MSNNDDLLLPQNQSGVLNLGQEQYKDEVLERSLELSTDAITNDITFGITDRLTKFDSDRVEIQRRSSSKTDLAGNSRGKAYNIGKLNGTDFYTDSLSRQGKPI